MQFAMGASAIKELAGLLVSALEDPDTYKRIEGLRVMLSKIVGHEIDKAGFVELLEQVTQGDAYTGKWELLDKHDPQYCDGGHRDHTRRLRVDGAWIYDIGRGNGLVVHDK